jgi:hypothetical protein
MIMQPPPIKDPLFGTPESIISSVPWIMWLSRLGGTRINAYRLTWDMATASGAVVITDIGFMPSVCILIAYGGTGTGGRYMGASWGISIGNVIVSCVYSVTAEQPGQWAGNGTRLGRLLQAAGASVYCDINSFQPDGAEVYFTKDGLPVGTSVWTFIFFA